MRHRRILKWLTNEDVRLLKRAFALAVRDLRQSPRRKKSDRYSQERLALETGLDRSYLSALERGQHNPTLATLFRLAEVLHVSPTSILRQIERRYLEARQQKKA